RVLFRSMAAACQGQTVTMESICPARYFDGAPGHLPEVNRYACRATPGVQGPRLSQGVVPCSTWPTWWLAPFSSRFARSTRSPATLCEGRAMIFDYVLGSIVTIGLLVYLVYALIRPERF